MPDVKQTDIPTLQISDAAVDDLPAEETAEPTKELPTTLKINGISNGELPPETTETSQLIHTARRRERMLQVALAVVCVLLLYFILSSFSPGFSNLLAEARPALKQYWPNMIAVIAIVVLGFNLYTLRGYKRFWFGIAELLLGVGIGWYAINKAFADSVSDAIVILFAALYLVGRGWVNIAIRVPRLQIEKESDDD